MKRKEWTQIKVGLFVFFGLIMTMIIIFFLGNERQFFSGHYTLKCYFNDISGLRVGAQVQLAGLNVGMVESIHFVESVADKRILVNLSIGEKYKERIREDSLASVNTLGLLGDKLVGISIGSADKPMLQDGAVLGVEEKADIFSIISKGSTIVDNVNKASSVITNILEEIEKGDGLVHSLVYEDKNRPIANNVSETIRELKEASNELGLILKKVNEGQGTIGALVADPSVYNDIRRLFGKLERNTLLKHIIRSRIRDLEN